MVFNMHFVKFMAEAIGQALFYVLVFLAALAGCAVLITVILAFIGFSLQIAGEIHSIMTYYR